MAKSKKCCCCFELECGIKCIGTLDILSIFLFAINIIIIVNRIKDNKYNIDQTTLVFTLQPLVLILLVSIPRAIAFCAMMNRSKNPSLRKTAYLIRIAS